MDLTNTYIDCLLCGQASQFAGCLFGFVVACYWLLQSQTTEFVLKDLANLEFSLNLLKTVLDMFATL